MIAKLTFPESLKTLDDLLHGLGDISPRRIRLHPFPGTATAEDVDRNKCCELVDGILVEKAMGLIESMFAAYFARLIGDFVEMHDLGLMSAGAGPYRLEPALVRSPDIAFVSWERLGGKNFPTKDSLPSAPNLATEVLSPGNTKSEMERKTQEYFKAGVEEVWMVDLVKRTIKLHTSPETVSELGEDDTLDTSKVLPGFSLSLRTLFSRLDRGQTNEMS